MAEAMFGAGCFWGIEETFRRVPGVTDAAVGYAGGHKDQPTYQEVCSGTTGHAEVVHVTYDPGQVTYEELLTVFFGAHDPTQVDRQGPDIGAQYRSVVFTYDDVQKKAAEDHIAALEDAESYRRPIATAVEPAPRFWRAEEYHQQYMAKARGEVPRTV